MHQYEDLKTTLKRAEKGLITVANNSIDNIKTKRTKLTRKQKWENYMGISSDKQQKSYTRRHGHYYEKETLREKLNLF